MRVATAGQPALAAQVEALLRGHADEALLQPGAFATELGSAVADALEAAGAGSRTPGASGPGPVDGRGDVPGTLLEVPGFRLRRRLAVGGMGAVYEAEQLVPRRRVALKVLRPELASPEMVRRLAHEAEVLARLEHPRIARLLSTVVAHGPSGPLPCLVLEYVDGIAITAYAARLAGVRERMDLLARTAAAVAAAHAAGVVHRDLKPSNVLVDAQGRPKVLDFGIARLAADPGAPTSMHTQAGLLLGTLAYMSPEQARGDVAQVDTRSDVYALGVLGYEMLAGRPPHDVSRLPLAAAVRRLAEEPAPSITLVRPGLPGDLGVILGKALAHEPGRRYQGAAAFGEDLQRWLAGEPVLARAPTLSYLLGTYVRRHRLAVAAAAAVLLALVLGAAVALTFAVRARDEAARADRRSTEALAAAYESATYAALRALDTRRGDVARQALTRAPEALRGWEWRHASAQVDPLLEDVRWAQPLDALLDMDLDAGRALGRGAGGEAWVLDLATGRVQVRLASPGPVRTGALVGHGREALLARSGDPVAVRCDALSGAVLGRLPGLPVPVEHVVAEGAEGGAVLGGYGAGEAGAEPAGPAHLARWRPGAGALEPLAGLEPGRRILSLAAAPQGGRLLVGLTGRSAALLGARDDAAVVRVGGHDDGVLCAAWASDGASWATGGTDRIVLLRGPAGEAPRLVLRGHGGPLHAVALSADGGVAATLASDSILRVFDGRTGEALSVLPIERRGGVPRLAFAADGRSLTLADAGGRRTWAVGAGEHDGVLRGHGEGPRARGPVFVYGVRWAPDGRRLLSAAWDRTCRIWDATTGDALATLPCQGVVLGADWSPDGRQLVSVERGGVVALWDARTGERSVVRERLASGGERNPCRFAPAGDEVLLLDRERRPWRVDARTLEDRGGVPGFLAPGDGGQATVAAWADGGRAVLVGTGAGVVTCVDLGSGEARWSVSAARGAVAALEASPDGRLVAVGAEDGSAVLLGRADGAVLAALHGPGDPVYAVGFSPDGRRVATGARDRALRLYDTLSGRERGDLRGHREYVHDLAFAPDGETLASASGDGTVRLWRTATRAEQRAAAVALRVAETAAAPWVARALADIPAPADAASALLDAPGLAPLERQARGNVLLRTLEARR